jgi:hypothetical protein
VILPPGPLLPVHAGRVLLDRIHQRVPHAVPEDRLFEENGGTFLPFPSPL